MAGLKVPLVLLQEAFGFPGQPFGLLDALSKRSLRRSDLVDLVLPLAHHAYRPLIGPVETGARTAAFRSPFNFGGLCSRRHTPGQGSGPPSL